MNILMLNWRDPKNPKSGGAEKVTLEHTKAWVKNGNTVIWLAPRFKRGQKKEIIDGVEIIRKGNFATIFLHAPIFYLFSKKKFDIVIDQIHGIPFFTPLYVRKPKIAFIHEVADEIWDYMLPFPLSAIGRLSEPFYFFLYKNLIFWVPSESTISDLLKHGIKRKNCIKILCAINNTTIKRIAKKENKPTFIFVSRLVKMKGIEEVIDAFKIINENEKDSKLWIVGSGEEKYLKSLNKKVRKNNLSQSIKFFGYVSEDMKLKLMKKAHILLHASVKEGWGLVVVEAASQATPSVVYNVSGLRESVKNNVTGVVLDKNSPEELARQALLVFNNKKRYNYFQVNCLNWAKSFRWMKYTEQSSSLIERVASESENK